MEVVKDSKGPAGKVVKQVKHDILMKPETGKKQSGFFKSNKSRYPMYPCIEEKIKYDDYGEIIRIEDFLMDTGEPPAENQDLTENPPEFEEEPEQDKEEVPTKCVSSTQNFQINASVQFIDFEGRTDGESIMKLMSLLRPRRLILVRGSKNSLETMREICTEIIGGENNIFVPRNGEVVDATTERFIYQVRLRDSLVSSLSFSKVKDDGYLAWVDGVIKMTEDERADIVPLEEKDEESENDGDIEKKENEKEEEIDKENLPMSIIPVLDPMSESDIKGHTTNFVNELKLSDFKLILTNNGIPSEFQQGNLMCGHQSNVQLRRHESGRVMIEGCLSDDYYVIRELLYQQYAIV